MACLDPLLSDSLTLDEGQREQFIRDGYVRVSGLIPRDLAITTRENLFAALEIDPADPASWAGKNISADPRVIALTEPCRTAGVEAVAEQLVGPHFLRGLALSPYLESRGVEPATIGGYIPVLNFPTPGPREFEAPRGYHIDGMHRTTLWPLNHYLVVFAYLSEVTVYGGATTLLPGSHRQVFEHWVTTGHRGSTHAPDLPYAPPRPIPGGIGDVLFMHYLMVHSGSANHSDRIRAGLNTAILPDPERPYQRKTGAPAPDWTPLDWTLRTDNLG